MPALSSRLPLALALTGCLLTTPASAQFELSIDPDTVRRLHEAAQAASAQLLAEAIARSRAEALAAGTAPIPAAIRTQLQGFFPDSLLRQVRYRVGGGSELSLQLNVIQYGDRAAITLQEVIVFAHAEDAAHNVALWAHELWHVQQFQQWGLQGFAERYARDYMSVEQEAERAAAEVMRRRSAGRPPAGATAPR